MNLPHATPLADDHAVISIHREMATLRFDHARTRRRDCLSVVLLTLLALTFAVCWIAALYLAGLLALACIAITYIVVYLL